MGQAILEGLWVIYQTVLAVRLFVIIAGAVSVVTLGLTIWNLVRSFKK
jgi:hypothetical protein